MGFKIKKFPTSWLQKNLNPNLRNTPIYTFDTPNFENYSTRTKYLKESECDKIFSPKYLTSEPLTWKFETGKNVVFR